MQTPSNPPANPPAFAAATCGDWQLGASLRDYFAKGAMEAIIGNVEYLEATGKSGVKLGLELTSSVAKASYEFADAMLAARGGRVS